MKCFVILGVLIRKLGNGIWTVLGKLRNLMFFLVVIALKRKTSKLKNDLKALRPCSIHMQSFKALGCAEQK